MSHGTRTPYGTAVYVHENVQLLSEPLKCHYNDVEMKLINVNQPVPNLHVVRIYRPKSKVKTSRFIDALRNLHSNFLNYLNVPVILLGDFNINLIEATSEKNSLSKYLTEEKEYVQCINQVATDYKTHIDHIHTNIPEKVKNSCNLETYFSDHKPFIVSLN